MRRLLQIALVLLVAWTISAQPSMAQRRGGSRSNVQVVVRVGGGDRVYYRQPRPSYFGFFAASSGRPPGWDRGRKVGWGNCDLPPGQAKKYGCRGFGYRDYHRFRGNDRVRGSIVVVVPIR